MRSNSIVVDAPSFDLLPRVDEIQKSLLIKTLFAQTAVERLDERVVRWLAWPREVQRHAVKIRPEIEARFCVHPHDGSGHISRV